MSAKNSTLVKMGAAALWEEGIRSTHTIRNFEGFSMDEPTELGGTDTGGTPLEYMAATLNGCKAVMVPLIAKEQGFTFTALNFDTTGIVDIRGLMGEENVKTYFQKIRFTLEIETKESDEAIERLKAEVERRCPVYNLFTDAGIPVDANWIKK
ncbi:osmotically inducible protein C [Sporosarcina sp. P13]|uniref:OsmC family protein n=1 Tax=Sporosarcina sp. P13 TaxID=2048263 RepID=UPI000C1676CD|nr:OsmC family protein [Sporosarcina sp. P13]PIC64926.1 osmotically inducible protein C [Sporosarcina sp. P13]